MIYYSILLLLSLPPCVRESFVLNVTQTSYQAEENHNITLEWMFPTRTDSSLNSLFIYCELFTELRPSVLFHFHGGVEVTESQDQQFTGQVWCDKDVLRDGRIRLHMSRLRINDSGVYRCDVQTGVGSGSKICRLKVTAAADEPEPQRPTVRPQPERPAVRPQPERPAVRPQPERPAVRPQPERPAVRPQPERPAVRRRRNIFYFGLRLTAGLLVVCAGLWFAAFVFRRLNLLIIEDRSIQSYRR